MIHNIAIVVIDDDEEFDRLFGNDLFLKMQTKTRKLKERDRKD